ncbi:hypothetical protein ACEQ8H_005836 [Pleosporales sp. CAS-2024a]
MAPSPDLTPPCPPARIPKLRYRNPLPPGETIPSLQARRDSAHHPPHAPSDKASSEYAPSMDSASLTSTSLASTVPSVHSSDDAKSSKKKKKTSVFGFLSIKEPSQDALKQYADAQRKQAAEKDSASLSGSQPSTSIYAGKKLPDTVPKVNTKWDGVPDALKKHRKKSRNSVHSQSSQTSRASTATCSDSKIPLRPDGTCSPPNFVASPLPPLSGLALLDTSRPASPVLQTTTAPDVSEDVLQPVESAVPHVRAPLDLSTSDPTCPLDQLPGLRSDSPALSTTSADTAIRDTADALFIKLNEQPQQGFWGNISVVQSREEDMAVAVPESHDFLFDNNQHPTVETPEPSSPMEAPSIPRYSSRHPVPDDHHALFDNIVPDSPMTASSVPFHSSERLFLDDDDDDDQASFETLESSSPDESPSIPRYASHRSVPNDDYSLSDDSEPASPSLTPPVPRCSPRCLTLHDEYTLETPEAAMPMEAASVSRNSPRRIVLNFNRPMSPSPNSSPGRPKRTSSYRIAQMGSALPTLYESSLASSESLLSADSDETVQHGKDTDAYSIAPSTVAPTMLSAHWHDSPRERLGLGGHLRMSAESPWESQGDEPGKPKRYRLSMFGRVASRA